MKTVAKSSDLVVFDQKNTPFPYYSRLLQAHAIDKGFYPAFDKIENGIVVEDDAATDDMHNKLYAIILKTIPQEYHHMFSGIPVGSTKCGLEAWRAIRDAFHGTDPLSLGEAYEELDAKQADDEDGMQYFNRIIGGYTRLVECGESVTDRTVAVKLVNGLRPEYMLLAAQIEPASMKIPKIRSLFLSLCKTVERSQLKNNGGTGAATNNAAFLAAGSPGTSSSASAEPPPWYAALMAKIENIERNAAMQKRDTRLQFKGTCWACHRRGHRKGDPACPMKDDPNAMANPAIFGQNAFKTVAFPAFRCDPECSRNPLPSNGYESLFRLDDDDEDPCEYYDHTFDTMIPDNGDDNAASDDEGLIPTNNDDADDDDVAVTASECAKTRSALRRARRRQRRMADHEHARRVEADALKSRRAARAGARRSASLILILLLGIAMSAVYLRNRFYSSGSNEAPSRPILGGYPDVSHLHCFGCECYVHVDAGRSKKFEAKAFRCIFVGYASESPAFLVYNPVTCQVVRSRNVVFHEPRMPPVIPGETFGDEMNMRQLEEHVTAVGPPPGEQHPACPPGEQQPVMAISADSDDDETITHDGQEAPLLRRSARIQSRHAAAMMAASSIQEPMSLQHALRGPRRAEWWASGKKEYNSLVSKGTWKHVRKPAGCRVMGSMWKFKVKQNSDGSVDKLKSRVVDLGDQMTHGVNYTETCAPTVRYTSIRSLLALAAHHDLEIEQLDVGHASWLLGMTVERDRAARTIKLGQRQFIVNNLDEFNMMDCKPVITPMCTNAISDIAEGTPLTDNVPYASLIGKLMYCSTYTRSDISCDVSRLSRFTSKPASLHWTFAKRVVRYLKGTLDLDLIYNGNTDVQLKFWQDASFAEDAADRKSRTGFVGIMSGAAVTWGSRRQTTVALSAVESEYMSLCGAAQEVMFLRQLLRDLRRGMTAPTPMFDDSLGAVALSNNPMTTGRSQHFDVSSSITFGSVLLLAISLSPTVKYD